MFWLIYKLICSGFCYSLACDKNRNTKVAIICGFIFGIFSLIYYIIVDKK